MAKASLSTTVGRLPGLASIKEKGVAKQQRFTTNQNHLRVKQVYENAFAPAAFHHLREQHNGRNGGHGSVKAGKGRRGANAQVGEAVTAKLNRGMLSSNNSNLRF